MRSICTFEICDRTVFTKKLCYGHFQQILNEEPLGELKARTPKMTWPEDELCTFEECNNKYHSSGYCQAHYKQFHKNKQLSRVKVRRLDKSHPWRERAVFALDQRATIDTSTGCIVWNGQVKTKGPYGCITFENKSWFVHRLAYSAYHDNKDIAKNETVHHKCSNTLCINPDHLELATHRDNSAEMFERKAYVKTIASQNEEILNLKEKIIQLEKEINEHNCK